MHRHLFFTYQSAMSSFLHSVAARLLNEQGDNIGETLVVFNNRRAGLFLQDELTSINKGIFFLPKIIGMDDFIDDLGELNIAPHEFLLFELFDIHRSLDGEDRKFKSFEEFISFGETMVNDFSQIDLYCVDAQKLFNNIHDEKRLGEWDVSGKQPTPSQEKYLSFYKSLYTYYNELRTRLFKQAKAYTGMAYRYVAENFDKLAGKLNYCHIYFVGFNALSVSEQSIIDSLVRANKASMICDGDEHYFSNKNQEAGLFLRKHADHYESIGPFENNFNQKKKTIHIVNCPENVLQAKTAGHILKQLADKEELKNNMQKCALVLGDEKLLLPVLNSLPKEIDTANVTMGFPYTLSNTHTLVNSLFSLFCHVKNNRFYHTDISTLFSNPVLAQILGSDSLYSVVTRQINDRKIIYASYEDIKQLTSSIPNFDKIDFLFKNLAPSIPETLNILNQLAATIVQNDIFGGNPKEKEALACFFQIVVYFNQLQSQYQAIDNIETLFKIYQRIAQRRNVAFYGKPMRGLQILGVLETRSLDFPYLIMTSVNEGTIPSGRTANSLIPYTLTRAFRLPSFEEKDAVYAYNFYRLLQRTDEAWLLYSSYSEGMGKGEPSRFLLQIRDELSVMYPNIEIDETVISASGSEPGTTKPLSMPKNELTLNKLKKIASTGFSPTALSCYRNCPLQFYLSYILGIRPPDEVSEDIESNELGSFIHEILCDIYNRDSDKRIRRQTLADALDNIASMVDSLIQDKLLKGRDNEGRNHLYGEVAKMQLSHFLKSEIDLLDKGHTITMKLTEEALESTLPVNNDEVKIRGIADRIDYFDGQLRVADYKSGSVKKDDLKVGELQPDLDIIPDKWFQVLCYAWLYCRKHNNTENLVSGIFPLRSFADGFLPAFWMGHCVLTPEDIDNFETILRTVVAEIMNPDNNFDAKPSDKCELCPFYNTCN